MVFESSITITLTPDSVFCSANVFSLSRAPFRGAPHCAPEPDHGKFAMLEAN
jgi:hypothetical protein